MTGPALFDLSAPQPSDPEECDRCSTTLVATVDSLRVRGWIAYDGTSFTGKALTVRICPACRRKEEKHHDATCDQLAAVPQVHPRLPGTDR